MKNTKGGDKVGLIECGLKSSLDDIFYNGIFILGNNPGERKKPMSNYDGKIAEDIEENEIDEQEQNDQVTWLSEHLSAQGFIDAYAMN